MAVSSALVVLYKLEEVSLYLVDIEEMEKCSANTSSGSAKLVCHGMFHIVERAGSPEMIIGPLTAPKFRYPLPTDFSVLSRNEITLRGPRKGIMRLIEVKNPGVGDMDELSDTLGKCKCEVTHPRYDDNSELWAYRLRIAANGLGWAIEHVGNLAAHGIEKTGEVVRDNIQPQTEKIEVAPELQQAVRRANQATVAFVEGVDFLISGTVTAAKYVAKKVWESQGENDENSDATTGNTIGESALAATLQIWESLHAATGRVLSATTTETAKVVGHKYGEQAGEVAQDGLHAVQNVFDIASVRTPAQIAAVKTKELRRKPTN